MAVAIYPKEGTVTRSGTRPLFQMPFPAGQRWKSSTYTSHSPLLASDLNWGTSGEDDFGMTVVASADGTVAVSTYSTTTGYGNYIVIDHGGAWTTYYCHLNTRTVSAGASVKRGQKIGTVGHSSAKYTIISHLHYEQRLSGILQKIYFDGSQIYYYGQVYYTSENQSYVIGTVNTAGSPLSVRSGPGTSYSIVGSVADGAKVKIYTQAYGTTITGTYGTTKVWDHIDGGYVSDAYIYTGSDGLVAPLE
ncbi:MAG: hypothetical protein A2086_10675 [Spirochaetes bacterium GWD1_27_9]|nr:MAG: hypothetical protein A2Z98_18410 [Spirochaetes bacterium GWB1_27_13]OHD21517.1 MAG: hypothetical protein A2Y34_01210 [Spirochaetes bacterium GWC1_27_15]OHD35186.1 MAG: hypothetical protein A2086_10675 [Spirochaetes bacterium GWD1_27_9]